MFTFLWHSSYHCTLFITVPVLVLCFMSSSSLANRKEASGSTTFYHTLWENAGQPWALDSFGKLAKDIMVFFAGSTTGIINKTMTSGADLGIPFIKVMLSNILVQQLSVMIPFVVGCSITILLVPTAFYIWIFRRHSTSYGSSMTIDGIDKVRNICTVWSITIGLILMIALLIFGASAFLLAEKQVNISIPKAFDLAELVIDTAKFFKELLRNQLTAMETELSRTANRAISVVYDIRLQIMKQFEKTIEPFITPVHVKSISIDALLDQLIFTLENMKKHLKSLTNKTIAGLINDIHKFNSYLKVIIDDAKRKFPSNTSLLQTLNSYQGILKLHIIENEGQELFDNPLKIIKQAHDIDLPEHIRQLHSNLSSIASNLNIDPNNMISAMRFATFLSEEKWEKNIGEIKTGLEKILSDEIEEQLKNNITLWKDATQADYKIAYPALITIGFAAILVSLPFIAGVTIGIIGTNGFGVKCNSVSTYKRTHLSNTGANVLVGSLYTGSCVLWIFWAVTIFLFLMSLLPVIFCAPMENLNIFNLTIDNLAFWQNLGRKTYPWYNVFSFGKWNLTVRTALLKCKNNSGLLDALQLDILFEGSDINTTKVDINFTSLNPGIEESMSNIHILQLDEYNRTSSLLHGLISNINVHPIFSKVSQMLWEIVDIKMASELRKLSGSHIVDKPIQKEILQAANFLDNIIANASTIVMDELILEVIARYFSLIKNFYSEESFNSSHYSMQIDIDEIQKELAELWANGKRLNDFIVNTGSKALIKDISYIALLDVEGLQYAVHYRLYEMKQLISGCGILWTIYEKITEFTCQQLLYGMVVMWLGLAIVSTFLLITMILSIVSIRLFVLPTDFSHQLLETTIPASATQGLSAT